MYRIISFEILERNPPFLDLPPINAYPHPHTPPPPLLPFLKTVYPPICKGRGGYLLCLCSFYFFKILRQSNYVKFEYTLFRGGSRTSSRSF